MAIIGRNQDGMFETLGPEKSNIADAADGQRHRTRKSIVLYEALDVKVF